MQKEYLQHCLKRLHNILTSGIYLNGNGQIETFLEQNISTAIKTNHEIDTEDYLYHQVTKDAFIKTFRDMNRVISKNDISSVSEFFELAKTIDDFQSKVEAWKTGCFINQYFLNSDLSLIY